MGVPYSTVSSWEKDVKDNRVMKNIVNGSRIKCTFIKLVRLRN